MGVQNCGTPPLRAAKQCFKAQVMFYSQMHNIAESAALPFSFPDWCLMQRPLIFTVCSDTVSRINISFIPPSYQVQNTCIFCSPSLVSCSASWASSGGQPPLLVPFLNQQATAACLLPTIPEAQRIITGSNT